MTAYQLVSLRREVSNENVPTCVSAGLLVMSHASGGTAPVVGVLGYGCREHVNPLRGTPATPIWNVPGPFWPVRPCDGESMDTLMRFSGKTLSSTIGKSRMQPSPLQASQAAS